MKYLGTFMLCNTDIKIVTIDYVLYVKLSYFIKLR